MKKLTKSTKENFNNKNIDIKVFNALNLINPALGEAYENDDFNPFEADFELKDEFVAKLLQNSKNVNVPSVDFLEFGSKTVKQHFVFAVEYTNSVLAGVENVSLINDSRDFSDIKLYLKNRTKLLERALKSLADANADCLKIYEEIYKLNCSYSEIMQGSFFDGFDVQNAINLFVKMAPPIRVSGSKKTVEAVKVATKSKKLVNEKAIEQSVKKPTAKIKEIEREM